jgi:hypothetical protein
MMTATIHHFRCRHARRTHCDARNLAASVPTPLRCCSTVDDDDLPTPPRHPLTAIKRDPPQPFPSHHHLPLSLLSLLDHFPLHITTGSRSISRRSPRICRRRSHRFTPPQATPPVPGASSSSAMSPRFNADVCRPPVSPPDHTLAAASTSSRRR